MEIPKSQGSVLVLTLVIVTILGGMVAALTLTGAREADAVHNDRLLEQARCVAEAGRNMVVEIYQHESKRSMTCC